MIFDNFIVTKKIHNQHIYHNGNKVVSVSKLREAIVLKSNLFKKKKIKRKRVLLKNINNDLNLIINLFALLDLENEVIILPGDFDNQLLKSYYKFDFNIIIGDKLINYSNKKILLNNKTVGLLTSGTSSVAKIAYLKISGLVKKVVENNSYIKDECSNILCFLDLSFGHGLIGNFLTFLYRGSNIYLTNFSQLIINKNILREYKINFFSSTPTHWEILIKMINQNDLKYIKRVHIGSAYLNDKLKRLILNKFKKINFYNYFGMTELCNWFMFCRIKYKCIYRPYKSIVSKMNLKKVNSFELTIDSSEYFHSYHNVKSTCKNFKTGDLFKCKNNRLIYLGRKSRVYKYKSKILNLLEIEKFLQKKLNVTAFAHCEIEYNNVIDYVLFIKKDTKFNKKTILKKIPKDIYPFSIFLIDKLHLNNRGKINTNKFYLNKSSYEKIF